MDCSQSALVAAAKCFRCHGHDERERVKIYLLCQLATVGVMANIVPPGSTYSGATPTFTLTVAPNTSYVIMWGANDLSMTMGGVTYNSTGQNTSTVVYTGANTQMVFTGTFAGTTVTVRVSAAPPAKVPIPSGFTAVLNAAGTSIVVGWDTPVLTFVNYTEVWTSNDNVTYSLAATVNFPTASTTVPAPSAGSTKYVKIRWCSNALAACGQFTSPLNAPNTVVSNWATRVVTNGGAAVSQSTLSAVDAFYKAISSFASLFKTINVIAPDSLVAARTPLIVGGGTDPWTTVPAAAAGNLSINGWRTQDGIGDNQILRTGLTPSAIASFNVGNGGLTIYAFVLNNQTNGNGAPIGCYDASNFFFLSLADNDLNPPLYDFNCNENNGLSSPLVQIANPPKFGFYSGSRTSSTSAALYFANSTNAFAAIATNAGTNPSGPPTQPLAVGGINANGSYLNNANAGGSGNNVLSFAAVHDGLTAAQTQTLYNAVQALRTALGGGFV